MGTSKFEAVTALLVLAVLVVVVCFLLPLVLVLMLLVSMLFLRQRRPGTIVQMGRALVETGVSH